MVNGFCTCDRQVLKVTEARVREVDQRVPALANGTDVIGDDSSARTDVVGVGGDAVLKGDAAFRVRVAAPEGTDLFRGDATSGAQPGAGGVRSASVNELGRDRALGSPVHCGPARWYRAGP